MGDLRKIRKEAAKHQQRLLVAANQIRRLGLPDEKKAETAKAKGPYVAIAEKQAIEMFLKFESCLKEFLYSRAPFTSDYIATKLRGLVKSGDSKISPYKILGEMNRLHDGLEKIIQEIDEHIGNLTYSPGASELVVPIAEEMTASQGFQFVKKGPENYFLSTTEARVIEHLVESLKRGILEVSGSVLIKYACGASEYRRLRDVFQTLHGKRAYRALIERGTRKGSFRLNTKLPSNQTLCA